MPEYFDGPRGNNIPEKPKNIDEAARASLNEEAREKAMHKREGQALNDQNRASREAHGRRAEGTKTPGPAERMQTLERFINTNPADNPRGEQSAKRTEPTPAQLQMRAAREAARQQDIDAAKGRRDPDKIVPELPKQSQSPSR